MASESLCPNVDAIASYVGGQPPESDVDALEEHLDACSACARVIVEVLGERRTGSGRPSRPRPRIFQTAQLIAGRYEVIKFLGAGGMGEVYEVEDRSLAERVALKTVGATIALDPAAVTHFRAEAALARKVTHRNVCRVFDLGVDVDATPTGNGTPAATPFLTMELIPGRALSDHIRTGDRFSPEDVTAIARGLAHGLEAAHEAGVLHRDLKSDNVLLAPRSLGGFRPVITDFGLAAAANSNGTRGQLCPSGTSATYGTFPYVAPERLRGAGDTLATDIYSLGVIMFELATGALLLRRPSPQTFGALPATTPLGAVIRRCLDPKPDRRPATAAEVAAALEGERAIATAPLGSRPAGGKRWWALGAAGAALALTLSFVIAARGRAPAAPTIVTPPAPVGTTVVSPQPAPADLEPPAPAPALAGAEDTRAAPKARPARHPRPVATPPATKPAEESPQTLLASAETHLRAGRIDEACAEGRAAARAAPGLPAAWEFLGRCSMRLGEPAEARDAYRQYLQLAPDGKNAVFIRAIVGEQAP